MLVISIGPRCRCFAFAGFDGLGDKAGSVAGVGEIEYCGFAAFVGNRRVLAMRSVGVFGAGAVGAVDFCAAANGVVFVGDGFFFRTGR